MFINANNLKEIKEHYSNSLPFYSKNELKQIVKQLAIKRLNISDSEFLIGDNIRLSESDILFFQRALKRLIKREPLQYILGETEFYGLTIKIDKRALIPRPETEELVDWVLSSLEGYEHDIADLCAGSGCIAFAIKTGLPGAEVIALEKAPESLELIQENKLRTQIDIEIKEFDVLDATSYNSFEANSFSCWVSNPPYILSSEKKSLEKNVVDYEPHMALFVGVSDPIQFYRTIADRAMVCLKESGYLFFEVHEKYGNEILNLLEELNFVNIELRKDLQGKPRMVRAQKSNLRP